jgi:hypothetical protein
VGAVLPAAVGGQVLFRTKANPTRLTRAASCRYAPAGRVARPKSCHQGGADRTARGETEILIGDNIVAIVMAAAATDGFISELAENISLYRQNAGDWAPDAITPEMMAAAEAIFDIEFSRGGQVTDKFGELLSRWAGASIKAAKRFKIIRG